MCKLKKLKGNEKSYKLNYLCLAKTNSHSKQLEKEIDESEECSRVKTAKRKIQRKLDDFQEDYENSQQEMIKLKNKIKLSNSLWNFQNDSNYTKCSFVSGEKEKGYSSKCVSKLNLEIKRKESLLKKSSKGNIKKLMSNVSKKIKDVQKPTEK